MKWYAGVLNLLYKPLCPICQRNAQSVFCIDCDRQILACQNPKLAQEFINQKIPLFIWGKYEAVLKRAVEACKYANSPEIAIELGKRIGESWQQKVGRNIALVPIPLHSEKLKLRGFNQAERLAVGFSDRSQIPCHSHLLTRIKNTQPQFQMSDIQARMENLKDAFNAKKTSLNGIILVDDIYTSGTTIREAIAAFDQVGTKIVAVVVLARPPKS